jgi:uncharacterized protein (UPF0218 family)
MKRYILPENLRKIFSYIHIYAENYVNSIKGLREFVGFKLRSELYIYLHRVAVVGDIVCSTFLNYVGVPRICIIDGKTLREFYNDINSFIKYFSYVFECRNSPGSISEGCIQTIVKALDIFHRALVVVKGEEDLLALAVSLVGRGIDYVVYGIPREGVGVIDVERFRVTAINLFTQFKVVEESN